MVEPLELDGLDSAQLDHFLVLSLWLGLNRSFLGFVPNARLSLGKQIFGCGSAQLESISKIIKNDKL